MKKALLAIPILTLALALFSFPVSGEEETYHSLMTGCTECVNCKKKVVMAFASLPGVESVRFLKKKKDGLHQVIIKTNGAKPITEEIAAELLKPLPHYQIKKWDKVMAAVN